MQLSSAMRLRLMGLLLPILSLLLVALAASNDDALPALLGTFPESFAFGVATAPVSPPKVFPGIAENVSQIDGPRPPSSVAPSIW